MGVAPLDSPTQKTVVGQLTARIFANIGLRNRTSQDTEIFTYQQGSGSGKCFHIDSEPYRLTYQNVPKNVLHTI